MAPLTAHIFRAGGESKANAAMVAWLIGVLGILVLLGELVMRLISN